MIRSLLIGVLLLGCSLMLHAQDIHYSQFYLSPMNLNPALTGLFNGDIRFAANFRSQWYSIPVPYTTFSGSYDGKILANKTGNNVLGGSVLLNYDKAGDSRMGLIQVGGAIAYALQMNKRNFVSVGMQLSTAQRRFKSDDLTFDSQFNGDQFDPTLDTRENFLSKSFFYTDVSSGINWHFQVDERTNFDIGVGAFHLNTPKQSFFDQQNIRLARKLSFYGDFSLRVGELVDLMPSIIHQRQGTYQETVAGFSVKYHLSTDRGQAIGLMLGSWWRLGDAVIPSIGIQYNSLRVGFSYDVNVSPLKIASQKNGGPEIGLIYIITKVKSTKNFKSCPIF